MAKGNGANMQDIYHPPTVCVCVCWLVCANVCMQKHTILCGCVWMSAFQLIDHTTDSSMAKSTGRMYDTHIRTHTSMYMQLRKYTTTSSSKYDDMQPDILKWTDQWLEQIE